MAKIILSVPHAHCRSESDKILHFCDVVAGPVAEELSKRLQAAGHEVFLHLGDINREETDLNRSESRGTKFRKDLEADFPKAEILVDVHSTPRSRLNWTEDIVILKWQTEEVDNRHLTYDLAKKLIETDLDVSITPARAQDDIVDQALHANLPAVLVEFSELSFADDPDWFITKFVDGFSRFLEGFKELQSVDSMKESLLRLSSLMRR